MIAGQSYTLLVDNKWDGFEWEAKKGVVFSEVNWLGGSNWLFGVYFLIAAFIQLVGLIGYIVAYFVKGLTRTLSLNRS